MRIHYAISTRGSRGTLSPRGALGRNRTHIVAFEAQCPVRWTTRARHSGPDSNRNIRFRRPMVCPLTYQSARWRWAELNRRSRLDTEPFAVLHIPRRRLSPPREHQGGFEPPRTRYKGVMPPKTSLVQKCEWMGSNHRPPVCRTGVLTAKLHPQRSPERDLNSHDFSITKP